MAQHTIDDPAGRPTSIGPRTRSLRPNVTDDRWSAGTAGALAALGMLVVQLLWRLEWSAAGVPSFPEVIVAAIARLTPLSVFGAATENYGSLAKQSLFVAVLIGVTVTGYNAGAIAGQLRPGFGAGFAARLLAGGVVAAALFLIVMLLVAPVAYLGIFAVDSGSTGDIVWQHLLTFALFAVTWAILASPVAAPAAATANQGRRALVRQGLGVAALAAVGGLTWRLFQPPPGPDEAISEATADEIAAQARARQVAAGPAPTSQPLPSLQPAAPAAASDPTALFAKLEAEGDLTPELTSVPDFYHVSKNISDPSVEADGWSLKIGGLVEQPLEIAYRDLVARAKTTKITTLCCISNELNGDLIGTAEWTGVPLRELLEEVIVSPNAIDLKFRCADDYEDSIPVARGMDPDTLVVVGMNGEPLGDDHGFPARLIIPGIYGMKNVKWVEEIEAVDEDFLGYWQTRGWSDPAPYQIWARIDTPESGEEIAPGPAVAAGVASAGDRGVSRVEISLDDGETWADAVLEPAINPPFTWVRWLYEFEATPGKHKMVVRTTDGEGTVATEERNPPLPDGATGWSTRTVNVED